MLTLLLFIPFYVSQILCIKMCLRSIKVRLVGKVRISLLSPLLVASSPDSVFPHPCSEVPDISLMSGSWARLFSSLSLLQCSAICIEIERSQKVHPSCSRQRESMALFEEFLVAGGCNSGVYQKQFLPRQPFLLLSPFPQQQCNTNLASSLPSNGDRRWGTLCPSISSIKTMCDCSLCSGGDSKAQIKAFLTLS